MANGITTNPFLAAFEGFQGAQQRAIQQQQAMQAAALNEQLKQIQIAAAQQQLLEATKTPQQRLAEQIQEAFAVDALKRGALVQAPIGLEGEAIALPSAIGQTAAQLESTGTFAPAVSSSPLSIATGVPEAPSLSDALSQIVIPQPTPATFNIPTAPSRGFEQPTGIPGFNISEEAARQRTAQDIARATQLAKAKFDATPPGYQIFTDINGNVSYIPKTPGRGEVAPILNPSGEQLKAPTKFSAGGLTANAQARVLEKAGTARISDKEIAEKYTTNGVTDWNKLILDSNKKISEDKSLAAEEKLKQIPAAERAKATGFIAAHKGLTRLIEEVNKFKVQGKEPDAWNRAVATALEAPPDGIFSALYQSSIGQSLSADEQTLNALKAMVRSAVTKANAGLSQTEREIANVSQYVPKSNDTIEETLRKGALLETYLIDQVESITTDPKEWLGSLKSGESVNAPSGATTTAPGSTQIGRFTVRPR